MSGKKRKTANMHDLFDKRTRALSDESQNLRNMIPIPPVSEFSGPFARFSHEILSTFAKNYQSYQSYLDKRQFRDALLYVLKDTFPYAGLYIVGSSGNSFGTKNCDLDLCFMVSQEEIDQKHEAPEILKLIQVAFRQMNFIERCRVIRARVPLLKFRDSVSGIKCSMNLNNHISIRNTFFLRCYAELDKRVKPLVVCMKLWAKYQDINDASKRTLSSYSLTLMMIHFLQVVDPPVLPVLHELMPEKFDINVDIRTLSYLEALPDWQSENKLSAGELFINFLDYYGHEFDFANNMISVRLGKAIPKAESDSSSGKADQKFICIEEPFDLSNTARSVHEEAIFLRILRVFKRSYEKIMETKQFTSITLESF